ncbi:MAG: hypothetical protein PHT40_04190 [Patescibacteria group bacterium]|nr:hypothetical protein [Patescibacteria group bacterium]
MKVLYVDDCQKNLVVAQKTAKEISGLELVTCSTAKEALSFIDNNSGLSFVISDMMFFEQPDGEILVAYGKCLDIIRRYWTYLQGFSGVMQFTKNGPLGKHGSFEEEFYRLENGKVSNEFLKVASDCYREWAENEGYFSIPYLEIRRQFALGLIVVDHALSRGIEAIICTEGHRHDLFLQMSGIVQVPLVAKYPQRFVDVSEGYGDYFEPKVYRTKGKKWFSFYEEDVKKGDEEWWGEVLRSIVTAPQPFTFKKDSLPPPHLPVSLCF